VNVERRNKAESRDDRVKTHGLDEVRLARRLKREGEVYQPERKEFR
jgi:hypothetical protein